MLDHNPTAACLDGERYASRVCDTLDLADRMALAVNALTNAWYPEERWALGFVVDFSQRPPVLFPSHLTDAYLNIPPKFLEALALCRLGSGSDLNLHVDAAVLNAQLDLVGEDGLTYCPPGTLREFPGGRGFAEIWGEGRMLSALATLAQVDPDPRWIALGRRKVDRLLALSIEKDDFRCFWRGRFWPGDAPPSGAAEPAVPNPDGSLADSDPAFSKVYSIGALGVGAGLFHRVTGYEPALALSRGLARWGLKRLFHSADGRYDFWHFHHGLYALMAVWEYAQAADDRGAMERVDACYRWARDMGDPLIGFFPELMPDQDSWRYLQWDGKTVETCEVADMIWLALNLTRAGLGDYWDDVDRWTRNMLAEGQLCRADFYDRIPERLLEPASEARPHQDARDIAARSVGSFLGWMRANDGLRVSKTERGQRLLNVSIMHCCTANGARALYHVWDAILTRRAGAVDVNLLLNRASAELDVDSRLPAAGQVVLTIKRATAVRVRVPGWCDLRAARVRVSGQERAPACEGRYLRLDDLRPDDRVELSFPQAEHTVRRVLGDLPYALTLRGANVVNIEPRGIALPLYEDQPAGAPVERQRFVPRRAPIW
jgi:hypothetical protein